LATTALLEVNQLDVAYSVNGRYGNVVRGLTFSLQSGEAIGLLGESGCGKTTTALALLGLMPAGTIVRGSVRFRGLELIGAGEGTLQPIRGRQISIILQEPLLNLNPVLRVVDQVAEVVRAHHRVRAKECRDRARAALDQTGLTTRALQTAYPHQLSGGQRQRVVIAQAIVCRPALIIADEPTASLDAISQREILTLLGDMVRQLNSSLLLISHDPRVVAAMAERVLVMYAGRIVEAGPAGAVLGHPLHPFAKGLLRCLLDAKDPAVDRHVPAVTGIAPDSQHLPSGCAFEPRCQDRMPVCAETEPLPVYSELREVRCFLYGERH
jgi:peptide/nickel transport system ATP-binding protein